MTDPYLQEDQYEQAPVEQGEDQYGEIAELQEEPRQRYKSTKGDADKRKITSKINAKRAREKKLSRLEKLKAKQAKKKEKRRYDSSESDSSDSDSEYEYALSRKKRKAGGSKKPKVDNELIERLGNVEEMLSKMAYATKKTAKRVKRVANPPPKPAPEKPAPQPIAPQHQSNNELLNHLKRGIIIK